MFCDKIKKSLSKHIKVRNNMSILTNLPYTLIKDIPIIIIV